MKVQLHTELLYHSIRELCQQYDQHMFHYPLLDSKPSGHNCWNYRWINRRLLLGNSIHHFDNVVRTTWDDPHIIGGVPRGPRLNFNGQSRWNEFARLFESSFAEGLLVVDEEMTTFSVKLEKG